MSRDLDTAELTVTRVLPVVSAMPPDSTPDDHADAVGLVYVSDDAPGISRLRWGGGFTYRFPDGDTVPRGHPDRQRAEGLAIPPAWTDVWVCLDPKGHVQATGRDDADRKQYIYHPRWREVRDATKFHGMHALVVALLDETLIRIGSERYARTTGAHGLTTLEHEHLEIDGNRVRFSFPGKSGQEREVELRHRRLARQLLKCEEIPGQRLFSYDGGSGWREVGSGDVNAFLREISGDELTAKDFRTWGATVVAAETLRDLGPPRDRSDAEDDVLTAVDVVAERLGNTRG